MPKTFRKTSSSLPPDFFEVEAAGLRLLAAAREAGGPQVAEVIDVGESRLEIEFINSSPPSAASAHKLGVELGHLHNWRPAPNHTFGANPYSGSNLSHGYFGPLSDPVPMSFSAPGAPAPNFQTYFKARLNEMLDICEARGYPGLSEKTQPLLTSKWFNQIELTPSLVHGDLWSGNLIWTERSGALIDPAVHIGAGEEDLALLQLFGVANFDDIIAGYQTIRPLKKDWQTRLYLHNLYPIAAHIAFFGTAYLGQFNSTLASLLIGRN